MGDLSYNDPVADPKTGKKTARKIEGDFVFCLDATTGKELWKTAIGSRGGDGPRCTPTVDGDRVYALTRQGGLACLKISDGSMRLAEGVQEGLRRPHDVGLGLQRVPHHRRRQADRHPLGGKEAADDRGSNKNTGAPILWKCEPPRVNAPASATRPSSPLKRAGSSSTSLSSALNLGLVGVDAKTGKFLLANYKKIANGTANIPTPIVHGEPGASPPPATAPVPPS